MGYLSEALKKYYKRQNGKITFVNNQTLNQLSLLLWEQLRYSQIDSSVLSRVLNGNRLFTPQQLDIFCKTLDLENRDKDILLQCLHKDYCERYDINLESFYIAKTDLIDLLNQFSGECYQANSQGKLIEVIQICDKIENFSEYLLKTKLSESMEKQLYKILALNLYTKVKSQAAFFIPQEALDHMMIASKILFALSKKYNDRLAWCYGNILLAYAYCIAGQDNTSGSKSLYEKSILSSKKTLAYLPGDDSTRIFALHVMGVSATYSRDYETINYVLKEFGEILPYQPKKNDVLMHCLAGALLPAAAVSRHKDPFSFKQKVLEYFGQLDLNENIYEMSFIKREIEAYIELKFYKHQTLLKLANKGLKIANEQRYVRHQRHLKRIIEIL